MGTSYRFICGKCVYQVMTSCGLDFGMIAVKDTYECKACKEIVDVSVGQFGETYSREDILLKRKEGEVGIDFYVCPICGSDKQLEKWNTEEKPCPRCDGKMSRKSRVDIISWD